MWNVVDRYYSGQGEVLIAERDADGNPLGFIPFGNVSALKLSISTSTMEHKESRSGNRATDLRLTTETKCAASLTVENYNSANLARGLRGSVVEIPAASVAAGEMTARLGRVVALPHVKVTDFSLKVSGVGGATLVEGTDYILNSVAGSVKFSTVITGVEDGDILVPAYSHAKQVRIDALTTGAEDVMLRFEGLNTADNMEPVVIEVFKFSTDPLKELALISDTIQQFTLEGSVLADSSREEGSKFFSTLKAE